MATTNFLTEDSTVVVTVLGPDSVPRNESFDTIDLIESGYSFDELLEQYKDNGAKSVMITVVF